MTCHRPWPISSATNGGLKAHCAAQVSSPLFQFPWPPRRRRWPPSFCRLGGRRPPGFWRLPKTEFALPVPSCLLRLTNPALCTVQGGRGQRNGRYVCIYTHTGKYVRALLQIKLVYKYRICIIARALIYRDLHDMSRGCMED